ncbi:hypothetical protein GGR56DRAFT_679049 [Xylariaceae sp. FL0804]|nr:hypothetical protein GGR56DRAFT_679049 [Xylariaceae sp. FL0804]
MIEAAHGQVQQDLNVALRLHETAHAAEDRLQATMVQAPRHRRGNGDGGDGKNRACPAHAYANELELSAPLPVALAAIFRHKATAPVYRDLVVLGARRYDSRAALDAGLIDAVGACATPLDRIGRPAVLVGHSAGGSVA